MGENTIQDGLQEINESPEKHKGKNKGRLFLWVMVALLFVGVLLAGVLSLLPQSITGAWELVVNPQVAQATQDEIPESDKAYYVFEKPDKYGKGDWYACYQGGVENHKYELLQEDSKELINLGAQNLEYEITGSKYMGNATLTIYYSEYTDESTGVTYDAQKYVFEQAKNPAYSTSSYKDYEIDEALLGEWISNERTLSYYQYNFSYTQNVRINDNGVMSIRYESEDLGIDRYMYYAYTATDSQITFSLVSDKDTQFTVAYEFDENGNLQFVNDQTNTSVFADAIFGDYTYYTPENLPEATQNASE